eukprot:1139768-Pelagomonas_calceolata.AAC.2
MQPGLVFRPKGITTLPWQCAGWYTHVFPDCLLPAKNRPGCDRTGGSTAVQPHKAGPDCTEFLKVESLGKPDVLNILKAAYLKQATHSTFVGSKEWWVQ